MTPSAGSTTRRRLVRRRRTRQPRRFASATATEERPRRLASGAASEEGPRAGSCRGALGACLALLALAACSNEPEPQFEPWLFAVPAGTTVHEYPQHPPDGPDPVRFAEELVIGAGGPAEATLYRPTDVAVSADGTVFVADGGAHHIKVFDADGAWRRNLGAEGQGPGEFNGLDIHLTIAGGRLVAYDTRNDRFSVWTLDGAHVADHKPTETRSPRSLFGLADGSLVWSYLTVNADRTTQEHAEHIDVEGELLAALLDRPGAPLREVSPADPVGMLQTMLEWLEDPKFVLAAGGDVVYFSPGTQYQVLAMSSNGDPLWALRRAGPPPGIPFDARDALVTDLEQQFRLEADLSAGDVTWPERIPAIYDLRVDGRGRLFVFLPPDGLGLVPSLVSPEEWRVHVYSGAGAYLGAGTVPAGRSYIHAHPWSAAHEDHVYRIATNASDEPVVIRYRVELMGE